ncbi:hypothetical protein BGX24_006223 [Mortierella sp. AD032]|nr:hypothetical protein BGX24_006223 [Mortierella sp. AD032]
MLSLKYALSVSIVLVVVIFAVPQNLGSLGYDSSSNLDYDSGFNNDYLSTLTTDVPVSPITIILESDLIPINNIQSVVNVFLPNVNYPYDYGYDYGPGSLGDLGALEAGPVGIGSLSTLSTGPVGSMGLGMPGTAASAPANLGPTEAIDVGSVIGPLGSVGALGALNAVLVAIVAANGGNMNMDFGNILANRSNEITANAN